MRVIFKFWAIAALLAAPVSHAAEFEVLDRFSVDGYSVLRGSADIPGGSFTVGGSTFAVQYGKVGIGMTEPAYPLDVVGAIKSRTNNIWDKTGILLGNESSEHPKIEFNVSDNSARFKLAVNGVNTGAERLSVYAGALNGAATIETLVVGGNGNVGVGTTGAGAKLSVAGILGVSETGASGNRLQIASTSEGAVIFQNDNSPIIFKTLSGTQEKMRITDSGSVGIGKIPSSLLDVAGTVTAAAFSGPLTGNVTGNASGSSGSCTGNAATATGADTLDGYHAAGFAKEYAASIGGFNDTTWTNIAYVSGSGLNSKIRLTLGGTTGNVVVDVIADILVHHSGGIYLTSFSGHYTQVTLLISSDCNAAFTIQGKINYSNTATLDCRVFPLGGESVAMAPASVASTACQKTYVTTGASFVHP